MWRAPNAQHFVRSGSNHACDKPKVTIDRCVFSIKQHSNQLVAPSAIQCVKKLNNHVEHVLNGVALEHGDDDQVEVCEITVVAHTQA
jgi:hypothetical protein